MILIASAAYLDAEFQIEFGRIPPAFLPIGNRRLYERQLVAIKNKFPDEDIYISLPDSYELSKKDAVYFDREKIRVIFNPSDLQLGSSILQAISVMIATSDSKQFRLLHGDTLLFDMPDELDVISVAETNKEYSWEVESSSDYSESVWCGFFSFANPEFFEECLKVNGDNFLGAVYQYDKKNGLLRLPAYSWLDFGHINMYFRSRSKLTSERFFNELVIEHGCVKKSGFPFSKIDAEWQWFKNLPVDMRIYAPNLIERGQLDSGAPYYKIEYLALVPLNEVYVHGRNSTHYWSNIFELCANFLQDCKLHKSKSVENTALSSSNFICTIKSLVWERVKMYLEYADHPGLDAINFFNGKKLPSLRFIINDCLSQIKETNDHLTFIHGDFCLSNILFDSRLDRIKVIDPRGIDFNGEKTNQGDLRYDLAKLSHSIIGLYDYIIAGAYDLDYSHDNYTTNYDLKIHIDKRTEDVQNIFQKYNFSVAITIREVLPLTTLLFFTMLPLHKEDKIRQIALLANALRLYSMEVKT
jgi:hypothetical protein